MAKQYNILNSGFKNTQRDGRTAGFQVRVLSGYYRGVYASLLEGFEVFVDGESYSRAQIRCKLGDRTYTQDELQTQSQLRWQWDEPVTLLVEKPGGLAPGAHDVRVVARIRVSYMPVQPSIFEFRDRIPLVG